MPNQPQGHLSRRTFLAASAAAAGSAAAIARGEPVGATRPVSPAPEQTSDQPSDKTDGARGPRMKVAEALPPSPGPLWRLVKQCGVDYAVGTSGGNTRSADAAGRGEPPWSRPAMERVQAALRRGRVQAGRDRVAPAPHQGQARPAGPRRRDRNRLRVGAEHGPHSAIPVWCYEWMVLGVLRTSSTLRGRGEAL